MSDNDFQTSFHDRIAALREERPAPLIPIRKDGFSAGVDPGLQHLTIVKFTKQGRHKSKGGEDFTDRKFICRDVNEMYARLVKNEPAKKVPISRTVTGEVIPSRESLGDLDTRQWLPGLDGKPADPWAQVAEIAMVSIDTGAAILFSTSSKTGRGAVDELKVAVDTHRRMVNPIALPIIQLGVRIWASERFGDTPIPDLRVVGWVDAADPEPAKVIEATAVHQPAASAPILKKHNKPTTRRERVFADDLDDEIPDLTRT